MSVFDESHPLHYAVEHRQVEKVVELINRGTKTDDRTRANITPLMVASEKGFDEIVEVLLSAGANPNATSKANRIDEGRITALHLASEGDHVGTCRLLLKHGAWPDSLSQYRLTPLNHAIVHKNHDLVRVLLDAGADPNGPKRSCEPPLLTAARENDRRIIDTLLNCGADPNRQAEDGSFALFETVSTDCARVLLHHGAKVNLRNVDGATVLMIHVGKPDLVRLYLQAGIEVNAHDKHGDTALSLLTRDPNRETAELLINAGANVNALIRPGFSVLDCFNKDWRGSASDRVRRKELIEYLKSKGARSVSDDT